MATANSETTEEITGASQANDSAGVAAMGMRGPSPLTVKSLPPYSQSLLRIPVSAVVVLAQKRQTLGRIVEFGPGSIIQFDKTCDEMLELHVGGRSIAEGEAVKVGDKFGLRVTSMVLPGERFEKVQPPRRHAGN